MAETADYGKSIIAAAHKTSHQDGGSDEISVAALSGQLADSQPSSWTLVSGKPSTFPPEAHKVNHEALGSDPLTALLRAIITDFFGSPFWASIPDKPSTFAPSAHKTSHQDAGSDEISVAGLSGLLADPQTPLALPKFAVNKNGVDQTGVVSGVWTKVTFTTEEYDTNDTYDAPNSKWIPGIIGKAEIIATLTWAIVVDQTANYISIFKNGAEYKSMFKQNSGTGLQSACLVFDVLIDVVTDYFEIYAYQDSGSNRTINGATGHTLFMGHMLV